MTETRHQTPPAERHELSPAELRTLRSYLDEVAPGLVAGPLTARLLAGGHSNLTFAVSDGVSRWVLRRPPAGHTDPSSHDMSREYTVMKALGGSRVPVPEVVHQCRSTAVLGAPFYLSEFISGAVYRTTDQTEGLGVELARAVSFELVDVLADLHEVDPGVVGLGGFGRPDGFLQRQVTRWTGQAEDVLTGIAGVAGLVQELRARMPVTRRTSIVHGDFRLDNVMVSGGRIVAVLDWEMATLGDPLADVGLLQCYWEGVHNPGGDAMRKGIDPALGFPDFVDLSQRYAERSGAPLDDLPWYACFGYLKLAVLRARIHQRYLAGNTPDDFADVGDLIEPLVNQSRRILEDL